MLDINADHRVGQESHRNWSGSKDYGNLGSSERTPAP